MGRKKKVVPGDPEQYARFVEIAERTLDENAEEKLEESMKKIAKARRKGKETKNMR